MSERPEHPERALPAEEPIAVVGMACRFPGADDLTGFWRMLGRGGEAIAPGTGFRDGRRSGGYLRDVEHFDAAFFGITATEAAAMDPQQRLLLELSWHALEDARLVATEGGPTGVFVGCCSDDYALLSRASGAVDAWTMTGTSRTFLANRVSYAFGFTGPSTVVDTGQSSSLAALHQGVAALRRGECATALVAGVQLNLSPVGDALIEELGAMSPTGRCHTFDSHADGIVRGEGAGVLVLKPLGAARADGDRIYCTVLATALNNDGGGVTLTSPRQEAQQELLAEACRRAGVAPSAIGYVELHGTGTRAGDPVEARALGHVLGQDRPAERPLLVGSVKTNIGHLEAAAGLAGLIKTASALYHRQLPPTLNHRRPNPDIDLAGLRLKVCTRRTPWPGTDGPLLAGVSAFGLGGTNVHAVLSACDDAAGPEGRAGAGGDARVVPVVVSARDEAALRAQAAALAAFVARQKEVDLVDLAFSCATTRAALPLRAAVLAAEPEELVARLRELAEGVRPEPAGAEATSPAAEAVAAFLLDKPVDWAALFGPGARRVDLPLYPFQRKPHWISVSATVAPTPAGPAPVTAAAAEAAWSGDPLDLVLQRTVEILGLAPGTEIPLDTSFTDLGLDSRMAVALRNALARAVGRALPTTLLFDHPTPAALIEALRSDAPDAPDGPQTKGHDRR
ncbi:acyl transferase domain-containing protein [Streptacidiphilus sp. MAP12-33]|uniref:beta-ketoacyl synthase N-terminal-like domain-containing protein n=1 Tax=Streptacidiphilus sp. MAP12-33 TaxID=3156266 RepID=UPI0035180A2A